MRTSRPIGGTVLLMCIMLLGPGPSAFAASVTHDTDNTSRLQDTLHQKNITIPWEHPPSLDGETYHFVYKNRVVFNVSPERYLAPIVKVDVKVEMTDSFR